ncbi:hypothetical protein OE88DRAFT_635447 [Heliocybe sulcata]|uniref:DUF6534 domain-containing protein n=1 Tax=Heliocybe sulcata TaxID=5364 RepID=A0A5C3NHM6_9AGAM|nr:hypothetical protein OE88DRAFT_635447 [Heliocybe sulcata]
MLVTEKKIWVLVPLTASSLSLYVVTVILSVAVGVFKGIAQSPLQAQTSRLGSAKTAFAFWVIGSLVLDIVMVAILSFFLWRSKTGLSHVDKTLRRIITVAWESAAFPFISDLVGLCIYLASPGMNYQLILLFILASGKFYTIGILRSLLSRSHFRARFKSTNQGRTTISDWDWDQESASVRKPVVQEFSALDDLATVGPPTEPTADCSSGDEASSDRTLSGDVPTQKAGFADARLAPTERLSAANNTDEYVP